MPTTLATGRESANATVAALFVQRGGCYWDLPGVDPWDEARDARQYAGPWPVVAHPPCDRWCQMAPVNQARYGHKIGADDGCFAAALSAVRRWGGVLEHPALTLAWPAFNLCVPPTSGWQRCLDGGWVARVEQRHYGHRARKATWLYAFGIEPASLKWGKGPAPEAWISADRPRSELRALGIAQLGKREAKATPIAFRDLLLSVARSAHPSPRRGGACAAWLMLCTRGWTRITRMARPWRRPSPPPSPPCRTPANDQRRTHQGPSRSPAALHRTPAL